MNKRRILFLITVLVFAAVSVVVFRKKVFPKNNLSDFAIQDTATITRIFLADKNGHQCTLDKIPGGQWRVNEKFDVQESKMQTLMDAIYRVRVKSPVPQKERDDVIKILATSVKVMIYKGDELLKVYYVGSETADYLGTYMCIENAESPMITEIPGFNGFLTPRFLTREEDWKSNTVVSIHPSNLSSLSLNFASHPEVSFTIHKDGEMFKVSCNDPKIKDQYSNQQKIAEYLKLFANLSMEGFDNRASHIFSDSLKTSVPFVTINITESDGKETWLKVFYKLLPNSSERLDDDGKTTPTDPNRYYAISNKEDRVMVVQIGNFGRVIQPFDFFR
ncbi:MAG: DUF4340 domain-containing protein [Bacteroidetes bacterium]|nr:DUF4340 domain-containing protein [Bacteroidota bacterium]